MSWMENVALSLGGFFAMALDAIVRKGVSLANRLTADLQDTVTHEAWIGHDGFGKPQYDPAIISRQAVVEMDQRLIRLADGQEVQQRARVTVIGPITGNGAKGRKEPVDPRDRITLPDGTIGPILDVKGVSDPTTGAPYAYTIILGAA